MPHKDPAASAAYKREYNQRYYEANRARLIAKACERQRATPEAAAARASKWRKNNLGVDAATRARRRAEKAQRTPPWADLTAIRAFYVEAAAIGLEVDHIYPLRGELVSGLHVETNLQLLTRAQNIRKGNRFSTEGE